MGKFYRELGLELKLAVRQLAWLNATPLADTKNLAEKPTEQLSRREQLKADDGEIRMPDCSAEFILTELIEIGPVVPAGMGTAAIGWPELQAWQSCTGTVLPPWRAKLLVELAREYQAFSHKATKPDCPEPCGEEAQTESRREAIAKSLRIGFRAMMARSDRKGA